MRRGLARLHLWSSLSKEWNPQKQKTTSVLLGQPTFEQVLVEYDFSKNVSYAS